MTVGLAPGAGAVGSTQGGAIMGLDALPKGTRLVWDFNREPSGTSPLSQPSDHGCPSVSLAWLVNTYASWFKPAQV